MATTLSAEEFKKRYGDVQSSPQTLSAEDFNKRYSQPQQLAESQPGFLKRLGKNIIPSLSQFAGDIGQIGIGAVKGVGSTVTGGQELVGKGLDYITGRKQGAYETPQFIKQALVPQSTGQKIGFGAEQIAEFALPSSAILKTSKALQGTKIASKLPNFLRTTLSRGGTEFGTSAAIQSAQQGKVNQESAIAGGISAAIPVAGQLAKVLTPSSKKLIIKAMGIAPAKVSELSGMAKSGGYEGFEDFALQKGFIGGRENMETQAAKLFNEAKSSKADILQNVIEKIPNKYQGVFSYLEKSYDHPLNEDVVSRIKQLSKKKSLTAVELDEVRGLVDDSLPSGVFEGAEPPKYVGIKKAISDIRDTLGKLDKTGTIKKTNTDIRVLYALREPLAASAKRSNIGPMLWRNMARTITGGGVAHFVPGATIPVAAYGAYGAATDVPEIASGLAQILSKAKKVTKPIAETPIARRIFGK